MFVNHADIQTMLARQFYESCRSLVWFGLARAQIQLTTRTERAEQSQRWLYGQCKCSISNNTHNIAQGGHPVFRGANGPSPLHPLNATLSMMKSTSAHMQILFNANKNSRVRYFRGYSLPLKYNTTNKFYNQLNISQITAAYTSKMYSQKMKRQSTK